MNETKFVNVIFTDDEWEWLESHLSKLSEDDPMVGKVLSAMDDGTVLD